MCDDKQLRRIGLLGGSFDPPHLGHLWMARRAREQASLDEVWLLPAWRAPHKDPTRQSDFSIRLELARLLAAEDEFLLVAEVERDLGGTSYTVDTVRHLKRAHPDCKFHLIIGGDSLADLAGWKDPAGLCAELELVVLAREGFETKSDLPCTIFSGETHPAQSRLIRADIAAGLEGRWLNEALAKRIASLGLYLCEPEGDSE